MPYTRMDAALFTAGTEKSDPQQFVLSWHDFIAFTCGSHPQSTSRGSSPDWFYRSINVVRAMEETANSVLHVLGSRQIFTSPIAV